ncbi:dihydropyrimidinase [Tepidibacter mesophilus]|uniref:dihydropyrimidinase n=1 Tax=Tepidibacter mesophilus TaxID=655607 RepID=UPI000C06D39F|nr:dihydropyrimidinase [Tepidibacter mesophilus]
MGVVIKGGKIITDTDSYYADLRIENEKIVSIGSNIEIEGDEVVTAQGCYLLPGAIDPHTHFDLDVGSTVTADDFESGSKAALIGGTTTIIDFATQSKGETLKEGLNNWHKKADQKCYCDYGFHMAITDWNENVSSEMEEMKDLGVTSYKMYMAYKNVLQVNDSEILNALNKSKEIGALMSFHCENGDIIDFLVNKAKNNNEVSPKYHAITRPDDAEAEAVYRIIKLAKMADAPIYIVHLSTKRALEIVTKERKNGVKIYVETCPQYLLLDESCYEMDKEDDFQAAKYVMSPPLRKKEDQEYLWNGIKNKDIDTVATDHCSFNYKGQKELGRNDFSKIPNGSPGVEHRLVLMYTNGVLKERITLNQMIDAISTKPAKLFGIYPQKGTISIGSDADIVIFNPNYKGKISAKDQIQNVDYTPYEGFVQMGRVRDVFLRGNRVVKEFLICDKSPCGKYIYRK